MNRRTLALAAALSLLIAFIPTSASASWEKNLVRGKSLGYAIHTPNVETTFASTPDEGVTLPAGTKTIVVCAENNPIRYFHGSTAATGTRGLIFSVGCATMLNDPRLISTMRFIDSSAGASTVTVEFYGENEQ